ncbi:MAG: transaldolase [Actinomycetaceae bacterium]|nr:transaldolase [Actinomycetaceae bacterium]MDY6083194.1 transaldolase [Actinomycetaceae bacterium]
MTNTIEELHELGVSTWLDDLSRQRIASGTLQQMIEAGVRGVTTNPSIFSASIRGSEDYTADIKRLAGQGASVTDIIQDLTTSDVAAAADLFTAVWERSDRTDGFVSIEVDPRLAHDTEATIEQAKLLFKTLNKPNVMIKIPATREGIPAITAAVAVGINVNATLIFSLDRYRDAAQAYIDGLEQAQKAGLDISSIASVASVFVSRVDTEVDRRLADLGREDLKGHAGIANARRVYGAFLEMFGSSSRFAQTLGDAGAHVQKPLWASTGVKNTAYPDTQYVDQLVAASVVNTMPEATLLAVRDHANLHGDTITDAIAQAQETLTDLKAAGIDWEDVMDQLEREGVEKFDSAWAELLTSVESRMK